MHIYTYILFMNLHSCYEINWLLILVAEKWNDTISILGVSDNLVMIYSYKLIWIMYVT